MKQAQQTAESITLLRFIREVRSQGKPPPIKLETHADTEKHNLPEQKPPWEPRWAKKNQAIVDENPTHN